MKCSHCNSEWKTDNRTSAKADCPFCGKSLAKKEEPNFYENSRDALAAIMKMYGAEVLLGKLTSYFPDFAPDVSKGDKKLVYAVYENDAAKVLKSNLEAPQADKERAVKIAIQKLTEAHISQNSAEIIIYEFTAALGWQVSKPTPSLLSTEKAPAPSPNKTITIETQSSLQKQVPRPTPSGKVTYPTATGIAAEILQGNKTRNLQFGGHKWRVLYIQGDKALLITEDIVVKRRYNEDLEGVTWETCTLRRQYLKDEFLQKFSSEERGKIIETRIGNPNNLWYSTPGGKDTADEIFLLSLEEVDRYFGNSGDYQQKRRKKHENGKWIEDNNGYGFSNAHDSYRLAKFNNEACWWWLRSPGNSSYDAAIVSYDGFVSVSGLIVLHDSGGVRPAFWLNLKS